MNDGQMQLTEYSEKACAVFGNTREYKEDLKQLGGKFNMNLVRKSDIFSDNGKVCIGESQKTEPGWIFPKSSYQKVKTYIETGKLETVQFTNHRDDRDNRDQSIIINRHTFDAIVERISSLEHEVDELKKQNAELYAKLSCNTEGSETEPSETEPSETEPSETAQRFPHTKRLLRKQPSQ